MEAAFIRVINKSPVLTELKGITKLIGLNRLVVSIMDRMQTRERRNSSRQYKEIYNSHGDEIKTVINMLADEKSKNVLRSLIKYRQTLDRKNLKGIMDTKNQYLPQADGVTLFPLRDEVLVDCGAYTGDTIKIFLKKVRMDIKAVVAFEPDRDSFTKLVATCKKKISEIDVKLYNCGVSDSNGKAYFYNGRGSQSRFSSKEKGAVFVQTMTIDSVPECENATFIKMDVEGAELAALRGAREVICNNKPKLAISIYHKPEDYWTIPMYISELNPEYTFYIRHHSYQGIETVLYAI